MTHDTIKLPTFGEQAIFHYIDSREIIAVSPAPGRDQQDGPSRVVYLRGGGEIRVPEGPELRLFLAEFELR